MSTVISYDWAYPDPAIVAQQLILLAGELEETEEAMRLGQQIAVDDAGERFKTGTDPSGQPWKEWAESYEPYAFAHSTGPIFGDRANLHLTGALEESMTSLSSWLPMREGLFLDTSQLPEYWAWNNFGAQRRTGRGVDVFGEAEPNTLPERPFVGLSDKARSLMDAQFYLWFEGQIAVAMSSLGRIFGRHSTRGGNLRNVGQFSKRV